MQLILVRELIASFSPEKSKVKKFGAERHKKSAPYKVAEQVGLFLRFPSFLTPFPVPCNRSFFTNTKLVKAACTRL